MILERDPGVSPADSWARIPFKDTCADFHL